MGGCSSKPQTAECVGHTSSNQELNSLLSGLKAIDPINPSPYKASQHTLQSLFIEHHRDGDDGHTLQELLLDSKTLPTFENESAGNAEAQLAPKDLLSSSCKHSSPISVLAHLAHEKCSPTEVSLEDDYKPSSPVLAEQHAVNSASSNAADCKFHSILSEPKSDRLPFPEPNLSPSISAHHVDEITASKAAAPDMQALEGGSSRHKLEVEQAQTPLRLGEISAECKTVGAMEDVSLQTKVEAEMELEKATQIVEYEASQQHTKAEAPNVAAMGTGDDDSSAKSHLQGEKAVECNRLQETAKKATEGEKAGLQAEKVIEGEKAGVQGKNHIDSEKVGLQNDEDSESENDRKQYREGEVANKTNLCMGIGHEGVKGELKDKEKASVQDAVTRVSNEHAEFIGSDKEESVNVKKVSAVQDGEKEELQCGLQSNEGTGVQDEIDLFDDTAKKKHEEAEVEIAMTSHVSESSTFTLAPMHSDPTEAETFSDASMQPDSTAAACKPASIGDVDEAVNCDDNEELKADQKKFTFIENTADLRLTVKLNSGKEKLASSGGAIEGGITHNVAEKFECQEKITEGTERIQKDELQGTIADVGWKSKLDDHSDIFESLENESFILTISEELLPFERNEKIEPEQQTDESPVEIEVVNKKVFDQALELCPSQDNEVLLEQRPVEENATDNLDSSKIELTVELEHDNSHAIDSKAKQEESIELHKLDRKAYDEESEFCHSSENVEFTSSVQIEKPSNGLDRNTHTGVEAVKIDSHGPLICPIDVTFDVSWAEEKEIGIVKDEMKAQLDSSKPNYVNREEPKATQKLEDGLNCADQCAHLKDAKCKELHRAIDDAPLPSLSLHQ